MKVLSINSGKNGPKCWFLVVKVIPNFHRLRDIESCSLCSFLIVILYLLFYSFLIVTLKNQDSIKYYFLNLSFFIKLNISNIVSNLFISLFNV